VRQLLTSAPAALATLKDAIDPSNPDKSRKSIFQKEKHFFWLEFSISSNSFFHVLHQFFILVVKWDYTLKEIPSGESVSYFEERTRSGKNRPECMVRVLQKERNPVDIERLPNG
jgi:hypothetical protein